MACKLDGMAPADGRILLITGVTGFLGTRLADLAMARGWTVRGLAREEWDGAPSIPLANRFLGDLPERIPAAALEGGVHAIVHCAATATTVERTARAVNVSGTERLAALAVKAGIPVFIHISSSSAAPDAPSVYGRTKFDGEVALRNAARIRHPAPLHTVILRPNLIVGPGEKGVYGQMVSMVERLPVLPMLAGGRSIVQPIHVDDLCEAILKCVERASELDGAILNLGHPVGIKLRDLLQIIAKHRLGRRKMAVSIPIWPIEAIVNVTEAVGLKLPVGKANLQGLKRIKRAETALDLEKLGIVLRPLEALGERQDRVKLPEVRPVNLILVGAGRMGLLHAATLSRLKGIRLAGLGDPVAGAAKLLHGLGIKAPHYRSLADALTKAAPEAAVIATPPPTHLPLATECSTAGLAVLVEKPLGPTAAELPAWEKLERDHAGACLRAGYVLPVTPHVRHWLGRLKAGELGEVRSFTGVSLMSFMLAPGMKAWQARKAVSGGGVLMNPGVHVLSMIHAAFGPPRDVTAESMRLFSAEVEDSFTATMGYGSFAGRIFLSWSIEGFARPEHVLTVRTSRGVLRLTGSTGVFSAGEGSTLQIAHQLDFPADYDMAPDFAGAGFAAELADLRECALARRASGRVTPGLAKAIDLERLVFRLYDAATAIPRFTAVESPAAPRQLALDTRTDVPRYLDLRDLPSGTAAAAVGRGGPWDGFEITTGQAGPWLRQTGERVHVTAPDFLVQSRLLLSGRAGTVLKQMGAGGVLAAGLAATPAILRDRGASFWAAADGLLAAGLARLPRRFRGTILLHPSLADLAITLRRHDRLDRWLTMCRMQQPVARIGFHTHLGEEAAQAVAVVSRAPGAVSLLVSPTQPAKREWIAAIRRAAGGPIEVTAEVGPGPAVIHERAALDPAPWAGMGEERADAVLIHGVADATVADAWREDLAARWAAAFPGMAVPADAW